MLLNQVNTHALVVISNEMVLVDKRKHGKKKRNSSISLLMSESINLSTQSKQVSGSYNLLRRNSDKTQ